MGSFATTWDETMALKSPRIRKVQWMLLAFLITLNGARLSGVEVEANAWDRRTKTMSWC